MISNPDPVLNNDANESCGEPSSRSASTVALIIVTHNSLEHFSALQRTISRQTRPPTTVIVVDSGSEPHQVPTSELLPCASEILLFKENIGFARANNIATERCSHDFIALLNPDAFPEDDWLSALVGAAERHPEAASIGSTQISGSMPGKFDGLGDSYNIAGLPWRGGFGRPVELEKPIAAEVFSACAAAALYRRRAWDEVGGFEETFFCYCEDVDLGFRMRNAGWISVQEPSARVTHIGGGSSGARSPFAIYHGTRNRIWTFVRNCPPVALAALAPIHIAANVAFLVVSPFRGTGIATWSGVWAGLCGIPRALRQRRTLTLLRRASSRDAFRWMSPSLLAPFQKRPHYIRRLV